VEGARWALRRGFAEKPDLEHTEEFGVLAGADPAYVSDKAKERGRGQIGTLGAGNHFIEIDAISEVFDEAAGAQLGLFQDNVAVQIHCGSRGLGHQICTDYVSAFQSVVRKYGINLPDRELVCAPCESQEAAEYVGAMAAAANYAFANRQMLAHSICCSFEKVLAGQVRDCSLHQVYDITHNMAKFEEHWVGDRSLRLCVHRKGATRAFGPGAAGLPHDLTNIGQPVLIPGSMGTESYVLLGTKDSMQQTFGSTCHGAGRVWSRTRAKKTTRGEQLCARLQSQGIAVRAGSMRDFAEETPEAYKDVTRVVEIVSRAGLAKKVARLEPIAVIKG
jgi:tRNA-splicing ligase RtcB